MEPSLLDIPIVCDYPDGFSEELVGFPSQREIEFAIDVVLGATSVSITPYRIDLVELKELKSIARIIREGIYSSECISMGSSSALC